MSPDDLRETLKSLGIESMTSEELDRIIAGASASMNAVVAVRSALPYDVSPLEFYDLLSGTSVSEEEG